MDCTHCEPVLLDLCYGELPPQHEREVRAHIHECPNCRKALSRLEAGQALARHLPDEPPPAELTERIMRAAEAHARRNNGGFLERVQLLMESMARIAMTRQVAMATLSLLIVFVGLWSLPELTRRREAHTTMVVEPTADGEAGPSRDVLPVAPEPLAEAPTAALDERSSPALGNARADRARSAGRVPATELAAKRADKAEGAQAVERKKTRSAASDVPGRKEAAAKPQKGRFAQPPPAAAPAALPSAAESNAEQPALAAAEPKAKRGEGSAAAEEERGRALGDDQLSGDLGSSAREARPAATAAAPAAAASAPVTIDEVFRAGVERYRADDFPAAVQLFSRMLESSAPSAQRAAALLYLARSERALGRCDRAIRAYETLVRSYGSAQQSASALSEGVACYDQLGDTAGANRLLEHASSVPSLSVQASKTREERSSGKPAAPAAPAEPSPR